MVEYRLPAVANLAGQLQRGPTRLRLKQLAGIEFLLSIVECDKQYPLDFVVHALTGFRPRNADGADVPLLSGEALRGDLLALAEELSASAGLCAQSWHEPIYSVSELAERMHVSTKTIFRWHRRGLVGWRFMHADRRVRLAFPEHCVARFVGENALLVQRGRSFSQLTGQERAAILERAETLATSGVKSIHGVARQIADESGRAVETIRLILKQHDDQHPGTGIFNRSPLAPVDDQGLAVWEAYQDGASLEVLAERFDRPLPWIYRTITQMRARDVKSRPIEFVHCVEFEQPAADEAILGAAALVAPYASDATPPKRVPSDLPPYLQQLFRTPLLNAAGEAALFRKLNYLKFKADRARAALDPESATAAELDQIGAWLAEAAQVKNQIVQANLRLVVSIAKRHLPGGSDFFELVSDGNVSLMRAVEKFDYSRGFKFSTYASWALMKNYARTIPEARNHRDRYQTGRDELLENSARVGIDDQDNDHMPAVRRAVEKMLNALDPRERSILRQRFGLDDVGGEPQTLEQIGRRFGVSKERVRQLEVRAMQKLRSGFQTDVRELLGAG